MDLKMIIFCLIQCFLCKHEAMSEWRASASSKPWPCHATHPHPLIFTFPRFRGNRTGSSVWKAWDIFGGGQPWTIIGLMLPLLGNNPVLLSSRRDRCCWVFRYSACRRPLETKHPGLEEWADGGIFCNMQPICWTFLCLLATVGNLWVSPNQATLHDSAFGGFFVCTH